ncbi:MAG: YciI family protein [Acidimicrobiales bacterium]
MLFLCHHRDRPGSMGLRRELIEQHWAYMDRFADTMVARGPTFANDGTLTGSLHILDLEDPTAARAFAFDEPGYQAGTYRDVLLRRWHNSLGRTMWDFENARPGRSRYLVLGFTFEPVEATELPEPNDLAAPEPLREDLIASGPLLSDDSAVILGAAVLLEAADTSNARAVLSSDRYVGIEVHQWRFGGRPQ